MESLFGGMEPRAEELIAEIYRQYSQLRQEGKHPTKVFLPIIYIRRIRIYHALMGALDNPAGEYLERHAIFGLDFFVSSACEVRVAE